MVNRLYLGASWLGWVCLIMSSHASYTDRTRIRSPIGAGFDKMVDEFGDDEMR